MVSKEINKFENNNGISVYALGVKGQDIYIQRKSNYDGRKKVVVPLLIVNGEKRQYAVIKCLSKLLGSSNSKHKRKQNSIFV